jgi:hypothetical protein
LELPPELEQKFEDGTLPTPFHPGAQWAGEPSAEPATTAGATTASAAPTPEQEEVADPLVGVWLRENVGMFHNNLFCYLFFGSNPDGTIVGAAWDAGYDKRVTPGWLQAGYSFKSVPPRSLKISRQAGRTYLWQTNDIGHYVQDAPVYWPSAMEGSITLVEGADAPFQLQSNRYLCRKERGNETGTVSHFRKLSLSESAALELPPELEKKFEDGTLPTPFHPGAQWAGESSAGPATDAGATTASAAPTPEQEVADPLVGIWLRKNNNFWGHNNFCYLFFGQSPDGTLVGTAWDAGYDSKGVEGITTYYSYFTLRDVPPRTLSIERKGGQAFAWHTDDIGHYPKDHPVFWPSAMGGLITLAEGADAPFQLQSNRYLCRKERGNETGTVSDFRKLSLSESAALKLHPELEQKIKDGTLPTPFHPGAQWAGEPPAKAATTAGATTASASAKAKVEKIPQSTDNEPQEFKETGR